MTYLPDIRWVFVGLVCLACLAGVVTIWIGGTR
jgi:hypothetical protein